jgi:hypothetical protein
MGEAFTIQTKHSLVHCIDYVSCKAVNIATNEWGLACKNCKRNKYAQVRVEDHYEAKNTPKQPTPAASLKDFVIAEVFDKLSNIDEQTLKEGATVFLQVNLKTKVVDVAIIDNIIEAERCLAKAKEHIQKTTALFTKITTPVVNGPTCFGCGGAIEKPGAVCPKCAFVNTQENIRKYDEP